MRLFFSILGSHKIWLSNIIEYILFLNSVLFRYNTHFNIAKIEYALHL